jgi:hypothetical protein
MRIERRGEGAGEHTATASHGDNGVRQVLYLPARPTRDGRTVVALSPLEFLAALSRLIPPPRVHRHRYHGVLAPNARLRERVINLDRHTGVAPGDTDSSPVLTPAAATAGVSAADLPDSPHRAAARSRWARLLARIYEVFPLTCGTASRRWGAACGAQPFHPKTSGQGRAAPMMPIPLRIAPNMRFSPAYNRDRPVQVWVEIPIVFSVR